MKSINQNKNLLCLDEDLKIFCFKKKFSNKKFRKMNNYKNNFINF